MPEEEELYSRLGVSSKKEDVHEAIRDLDKGLFPGAFCKIVEDVRERPDYCSIFHSDGAGTKSSLAYMYYKETGDLSIFKGIARDAMVMNIDDLLCVGATNKYFLSNNIGRNQKVISGDVIAEIINEYHSFSNKLKEFGFHIKICGGETADVGDIVKTLLVDASVFTTMKREDVIDANNIKSGDVIIGLASDGQTTYEEQYNSGIGSNGLTLARHGVLSNQYIKKYPECFNDAIEKKYVFFGKHLIEDIVPGLNLTIGKALLSPSRTYAPVVLEILKKYRKEVHAIIHNTGGGQTKALKFGKGIKFIKNNLFKLPKIFKVIQNSSETNWQEMYQVFNMGHRLELYCKENAAKSIIDICNNFKLNAKIIGQCDTSNARNKNIVEIKSEFGSFSYEENVWSNFK
jgi:phosphoribosylformylglycinamidine cyclo-ligase